VLRRSDRSRIGSRYTAGSVLKAGSGLFSSKKKDRSATTRLWNDRVPLGAGMIEQCGPLPQAV
jgi:hypothetical protein